MQTYYSKESESYRIFEEASGEKFPPRISGMRSLILGGILPLFLFTLTEKYFGTNWGICIGAFVGVATLVTEYFIHDVLAPFTVLANVMLLSFFCNHFFLEAGVVAQDAAGFFRRAYRDYMSWVRYSG